MIGNPGETEASIKESFRFALRTKSDSMQFYPLFVYPGTEAYEWANRSGHLRTANYRAWLDEKGDYACVIDPPGLAAEKIVRLCKRFYVRYHLRPAYILRKLLQLATRPNEGIRTIRSGLAYLNFLRRDGIT
jgi:radical SAM superfamily enzyme YgiQ (UPF0313 family)